jgi:hypothetical protein
MTGQRLLGIPIIVQITEAEKNRQARSDAAAAYILFHNQTNLVAPEQVTKKLPFIGYTLEISTSISQRMTSKPFSSHSEKSKWSNSKKNTTRVEVVDTDSFSMFFLLTKLT